MDYQKPPGILTCMSLKGTSFPVFPMDTAAHSKQWAAVPLSAHKCEPRIKLYVH